MKSKVIAFLELASNLRQTGLNLIRVAILIVFVWIGGLKFAHYEADGIVPFVANSPFMSFFYAKEAPEYKQYKNKEGELVLKNRQWHEENRTYVFSYGLGCLIMSIGILVFLGMFSPKIGIFGELHPQVLENWSVTVPAFAGELDIESILGVSLKNS